MEVEHLCARNKDGSKKTYEQMFYHVPQRRSQSVQVERERERDGLRPGSIQGFPFLGVPWCQSALKRNTKYREQGTITGFPPNTGYNYCQKLKIVRTPHQGVSALQWGTALVSETQNQGNGYKDSQHKYPVGARNSKSTMFSNERPTRRGKTNIVEYLGIAADEPARFGQLNARKRAPLAEFGIDEDLCGLYCQYERCLGPSYETSCRDGCWFCHNQGVNQLRNLWKNYPDHWALLMKWDLDSPVTFKADGHTVHDFDKRFRMEEEGLIDTHMPFRWAMLDNPPKFRCVNFEEISLFDRR